jgi:type I restriction enzyme M protein
LAVEIAFSTYPHEKWTQLNVADPACGTGGFLVAVMKVWQAYLYERELGKWRDEGKAAQRTADLLRDVSNAHLFGIDFNPLLVRAAQMNLVMHGDGSTNVYHANSLLPPGEWSREPPNDVYHHIQPGHFDIVVTNPPFGSQISIDDRHILDQFELAKFEMDSLLSRASMPPEQLFIERCLCLLKPGGRLAIVLPDSILSNPGLAFIRRWILKKARLLASVDLPQVTFEPYTGTQTSVLLLQRKTVEEIQWESKIGARVDYEVFMTTPKAVGHDRRGQPHYLRTPAGELIEHEETLPIIRRTDEGAKVEHRTRQRKLLHDDLPEVARYFREWVTQPERMRWLNG